MTKNQIEHSILYVLLVSAIVIGGYYGIIKRQLTQLHRIKEQKTTITADLTTAEQRTRSLPQLKRKSLQLTEAIETLERAMIQEGEFSDFLEVIKRAADTAEMKLKNTRPRIGAVDIAWGDAYVERQVQIETSSPYHTIGKWLNAMEHEVTFMRVVELKILSSQDSTGVHPAEITLGFLVKAEQGH